MHSILLCPDKTLDLSGGLLALEHDFQSSLASLYVDSTDLSLKALHGSDVSLDFDKY